MAGEGTRNNHIQGTLIGTDAISTKALGNDDDGINLKEGASDNVIGGNDASDYKIISGNSDGVDLDDAETQGIQI